jgi:hypothetical protein
MGWIPISAKAMCSNKKALLISLHRFLDRWFVAFWSVGLSTSLSSRLSFRVAVQFQQFAKIETWLLQYLDLQTMHTNYEQPAPKMEK